MNGAVPLGLFTEVKEKSGLNDLVGRGGIGFHTLRLIGEILFAAKFFDRVDQHISPQVFHAAALIKKDLQPIRETGGTGGGRRGGGGVSSRCGRGRRGDSVRSSGRGRRLLTGMNLVDQSINFLQQGVDIFSERLLIFDVFQFPAEKVDGLE